MGGAFGVRLAALVESAPPYYALLGLLRTGLVSPGWANEQAASYPSHGGLPAAARLRALGLRPTPAGWLELDGVTDLGGTPGRCEPVLADFLGRTLRYLAEHAPAGGVGPPPVERVLAQVCWLLSAFEDVYRSGQIDDAVAELFDDDNVPTVAQLRALAGGPVVAELVELARTLDVSGGLAGLRRLAGDRRPGEPLGVAGPVLVDHWADADLLVGRTLVDVKTVVRVDDVQRVSGWLWQLLGYAWLDEADRYGIEAVGLYLARHGTLLIWDLDEFAGRLAGSADAADVTRVEFLTVAEKAMAAEGARPLRPAQSGAADDPQAEVLLPAWVVPPAPAVAAVRAAAVAEIRAGAVDGAVGPSSDLGIWSAVQWVTGELPAAPLSMLLNAPLQRRVVAERLLAFEVLTGRLFPDEYQRYGYAPLVPSERFTDREYAGGVWHALEWLLGETAHVPGVRYVYRPSAAG